jgi:hypothetical protein
MLDYHRIEGSNNIAVQVTRKNLLGLRNEFNVPFDLRYRSDEAEHPTLYLVRGLPLEDLEINVADWIIKDLYGNFNVVSDEQFNKEAVYYRFNENEESMG